MKALALDVGRRRTGVSFADSANGIPLALNTIGHKTDEELIDAVIAMGKERAVDVVVLGLPLLLSGMEGEEVAHVRSIGAALEKMGPFTVSYLDERYTTPARTLTDGDAAAACELMRIFLQRIAKEDVDNI